MKKFLSIILAITIIMTLFASCAKPETALTATELLDLGEKYLLDLDYEQAIVYFNQVIEVEPKNARAYLGAAEAYVALGDIDSAIVILQKGIELVDDPTELQAMLAELLGENEEQDEVPEEEVVQEETVEIEPAYETTAVYYYNADESVSCSCNNAIAVTFSWEAVSGADAYLITWEDLEATISGSSYITGTSYTAFIIKNGYTYHVSVNACTGSRVITSNVGTAEIQAGETSSATDGLTVAQLGDVRIYTLSWNPFSDSTDYYAVYVDGAFYNETVSTSLTLTGTVLVDGIHEITVTANDSSGTVLETIGSLTLTVGDTSSVAHDDEDYEYVYDSDGKAISRTITTYAEDGSRTVEYQTRTN